MDETWLEASTTCDERPPNHLVDKFIVISKSSWCGLWLSCSILRSSAQVHWKHSSHVSDHPCSFPWYVLPEKPNWEVSLTCNSANSGKVFKILRHIAEFGNEEVYIWDSVIGSPHVHLIDWLTKGVHGCGESIVSTFGTNFHARFKGIYWKNITNRYEFPYLPRIQKMEVNLSSSFEGNPSTPRQFTEKINSNLE